MPEEIPNREQPGDAVAPRINIPKRPHDEPLRVRVKFWISEQVPLVEAFFVAVSLHVVALPMIWFIGWALPWPKPPIITTIMEYDLSDWPKHSHAPKKIFEFRDPKLNQ